MEYFRVALLQLLPEKSRAENLRKGLDACRAARAMGADLALFPEMWSNGYGLPGGPEGLEREALEPDDPFLLAFRDLARELDMAVGVTYLERYEPLPRNSLTLFDRFGRPVLTYAKVHTCDFGEERAFTPGEGFSWTPAPGRSGWGP